MSSYLGAIITQGQIIKLKDIEKPSPEFIRLFQNGRDFKDWLIIKPKGKTYIEFKHALWGLIPSFIKIKEQIPAFRIRYPNWQVKYDHLLKTSIYTKSARSSRCLVIASHFYTTKSIDSNKKDVYPFAISVREKPYFYIAGISNYWEDINTYESFESFTVVTTDSNDLITQTTDNKLQPTILSEELAYRWIFDDLSDNEIKEIGSYQLPSSMMTAYSVVKDFKKAVNPLKPVIYSEFPQLQLE